MKIGALDPYLATRGGGERYFLELALALAEGHDVEVIVPPGGQGSAAAGRDLEYTFGLDLSSVRLVDATDGASGDSPYTPLDRYAAALSVTNDYPPRLRTRPHIAILQFPWDVTTWSLRHRWRARRALRACDLVVVYSKFVHGWVEDRLGYRAAILPPPVSPVPADPSTVREKLILAVGRFTAGGHNKKHEAMIRAFAAVRARGLEDWGLVLVGTAGPGDEPYVQSVRESAMGLPVEIFPNLTRPDLEASYRRASLFWHATGFGEDPDAHPERMEHFGIAPVEAMSAGCIPLVISRGGLPEIVENDRSGILWETEAQLVESTVRLATDAVTRARLAQGAIDRATAFDRTAFRRRLEALLPASLRLRPGGAPDDRP